MSDIIKITDRAADRIRRLQAGAGDKALRFSVLENKGCAGFQYDFAFADAPGKHDAKVDKDGVVLYVDPMSLLYVAGTEIDWIEEGFEKKFVYDNPNQSGGCGCGQSFSV
ncbi:iron-sulfur cluster assembly accessory protein [Rhizobium leguminosarum]|uniref:HesB/IscA family protein n=1 Tax=Rhizobium leguminosarum TaxID=384 RepID=UPI002E122355|nr:iron-sulfur cluster assembly accessory protein [Rhizobium leguminosarum]